MSVASDAELLRASSGDPDAFATLVERHHRALFRYIARRLGPVDAEDIVNEVFLKAFTARGRYDEDRPDARPWLFGIATNLIRRNVRRETRALRAFAASGRDPISRQPTSLSPVSAPTLRARSPRSARSTATSCSCTPSPSSRSTRSRWPSMSRSVRSSRGCTARAPA